MTRPEEQIQRAIVRALKIALPHGWHVVGVSNNPRSALTGSEEKAMGMVAGYPDLTILGCIIGEDPADARPFTGFMEVKAPKGRLQPVQREMHDKLADCGFPVAVVRSVEDALQTAQAWGLPIRTMRVSA